MWSCRAAAARTRPLPSSFLGFLGRSMALVLRHVPSREEASAIVLLFISQLSKYGCSGLLSGDVFAAQSSLFPGSDVNKEDTSKSVDQGIRAFLWLTTVSSSSEKRGGYLQSQRHREAPIPSSYRLWTEKEESSYFARLFQGLT